MLKRLQIILLTFVILTFSLIVLPDPAWAWNKAGHMTSGAIAYNDLKQTDPDAITKVIAILQKHPEYNSRWQSQLEQVEPQDRDSVLFMLAARWPDDIRGNRNFTHPKWHYINFPFKRDGESDSIALKDPEPENILVALKENQEVLNNNTDEREKAIALCWIFHLIGDIHQPLHTTAFFSQNFPSGDRGGTDFYIRVKEENKSTISLHKFWDDLIGSSPRFQTARNRAIVLQSNHRRDTFPQLSNTDFNDWAKPESFEIAKQIAYKNGNLQGSADKDNGKVLPPDYIQTVRPIAQQQMALAGYRLADFLRRMSS